MLSALSGARATAVGAGSTSLAAEGGGGALAAAAGCGLGVGLNACCAGCACAALRCCATCWRACATLLSTSSLAALCRSAYPSAEEAEAPSSKGTWPSGTVRSRCASGVPPVRSVSIHASKGSDSAARSFTKSGLTPSDLAIRSSAGV